jgi:hypothetical protein
MTSGFPLTEIFVTPNQRTEMNTDERITALAEAVCEDWDRSTGSLPFDTIYCQILVANTV